MKWYEFLGAAISTAIIAAFGGFLYGVSVAKENIGRHKMPCFANKTCREGLKCLTADGIEPTCVKP